MEVVAHHSWLGEVRRYGENQLLATINIDPAVRPARLNGETDAEVLIEVAPALGGSALDAVLEQAADGIRAALADLDSIRSFALAHAPNDLHYDYPEASAAPLEERLFVEGFTVTASAKIEVSFDFGDSDMLVIQLDAHGHGWGVYVDR
ncbi:hypothetical protein I0C86_24680 [Plantactinospora sp. S1510]|uniref:DUF2004 domain-containing protein n=1 Tax=Plantactinospora alkalitolerans TaxID=2789879 RepID=A0ABS0H0Y2_9ACTN|nr:hypothetical protein [Plantactinospora alkalitolerans]MBF9132122.1 hypothetical protein [Plantactinospora alkalitolerans]